MQFFRCDHCGNIIMFVESSGVPVMCCGQKMTELTANTSDGAMEKHVPVVEINGTDVKVKIGEVPHPMLPAHHISWVVLETAEGFQKKDLTGDNPEVSFSIAATDKVIAAYEYCNLHGLWKAEI